MKNNNEKFKDDLKRRSYILVLEVIKVSDTIDYRGTSGQIITKQLLRSITSIGANIVEAQAGSTRKDFINFLNHALKSANESKFWLGLLRDAGKVSKGSIDKILQETTELTNILGASLITLKGKNKF